MEICCESYLNSNPISEKLEAVNWLFPDNADFEDEDDDCNCGRGAGSEDEFLDQKIWPIVSEYELTKNVKIKQMHAKYQRQFPILHGIVILTGMWSVIYSILEWDESLNNLKASSRPFDFLNLIPFNALLVVYLILMVIGVRNENNRMLVTFHISNLCQAIFMGWWTFRYCDNYYESVQECINFDIFFQTNLVI
ncbi:6117_t:CDS:2, partial [Entrophospora sp. SA101]